MDNAGSILLLVLLALIPSEPSLAAIAAFLKIDPVVVVAGVAYPISAAMRVQTKVFRLRICRTRHGG